jgi:hypothetical protein
MDTELSMTKRKSTALQPLGPPVDDDTDATAPPSPPTPTELAVPPAPPTAVVVVAPPEPLLVALL